MGKKTFCSKIYFQNDFKILVQLLGDGYIFVGDFFFIKHKSNLRIFLRKKAQNFHSERDPTGC